MNAALLILLFQRFGMKRLFVSLVLFNQSFKALSGPLVEQLS